MAEEFLVRRSKFVIAPVAKIGIEPNREQFQVPGVAQANSLNLLIFEDVPAFPGDAPLLYNIGENKQTDTQRAAVGEVTRRFAANIIDLVTDLHPRESPVMQNESVLKKSACAWPQAGQNYF